MSAVLKAVPQDHQTVAVPEADIQSLGLLNMIERAARDPDVDIDKFERLLAVKRAIEAERKKEVFNAAMADAQSAMGRVSADRVNKQTQSAYASYAALDRMVRPIYTQHGFALSFDEGETDKPEHIRVVCLVSHRLGHERTYHRDMPADGKGAKGGDVMTKTHANGSAMQYGMRYLLKGIFNIAIGDDPDDDDGNGGQGNQAETTGQRSQPGSQPTNQQKADTKPAAPDDWFKAQLEKAAPLLRSGTRKADDVIASFKTKASLSAAQEKAIRDIKPEGTK